jgi:hypothetical protein
MIAPLSHSRGGVTFFDRAQTGLVTAADLEPTITRTNRAFTATIATTKIIGAEAMAAMAPSMGAGARGATS